MEGIVIATAGISGLAGLNWPSAALAGALVFVLIELSTRDSPPERLANWQIGPWRSLAGASFIGAGECCLGWTIGASLRLLLG
jgi:uncharacterized membrane protein YkgB